MPALQVGQTVHCKGTWKNHPKHGPQFEVEHVDIEMPKHAGAIEKFLGSGCAKGIGPGFAAKIVAKFGKDTLDIIEKTPDRLLEIEGLGVKRKDALADAWQAQKTLQDVVIFLHGYGISRTYARRILKVYGNEALKKIQENPYQLAHDIPGIGFAHADSIAKHLGFQDTFPERIQAGIGYVLSELASSGHTCFPIDPFAAKAQDILHVDAELIRLHIGRLFQQGEIELQKLDTEELFIWQKPLFVCESGIGAEIARIKNSKSNIREIAAEKAVTWAEAKLGISFALQQKQALEQMIQEKVCIITGGPGTGKSTITKAMLTIFRTLSKNILLAAPTGRAAKRLAEITKHPASTIHRILQYDFTCGKFKHNRDNPLYHDLIIIDEASMIDTYLMYQFLQALPNHAKVVIIGDANQLPSIGPGNVLKDLIESQKVPTTKLSAIFRQAKGSQIIINAHRINEGQMPQLTQKPGSDFYFFTAKEPEEVRKTIIELITKRIPQQFGFDAKKEIQLLVPMRKGSCGIEALNHELQNALTPIGQGATIFSFRVGDKVMQLRNNYMKDVFNGDIGTVMHINSADQQLIVAMDEKSVTYDATELDELVLAYAVSVHKYQGSECPCIVMPVHTVHFKLLTKNLLYTAVTRGRKLVCLVGTGKALAIAVHNQEVEKRYTGLAHFMRAS